MLVTHLDTCRPETFASRARSSLQTLQLEAALVAGLNNQEIQPNTEKGRSCKESALSPFLTTRFQ